MDPQFATQGEWRVICLMVIVFVAVCVMGFIAYPMDWQTRFYRWLKGSRKSYYLIHFESGSHVASMAQRLRCGHDRILPGLKKIERFIIEIRHGFFRKSSSIHGCGNPMFWAIANDFKKDGIDWVCLKDEQGLPVETALRLVNFHPSLQAMLDRIAELEIQNDKTKEQVKGLLEQRYANNYRIAALEYELAVAKNLQEEWLSGVGALSLEIDTDRQRYRSPAAAHIRECLKVIIDWAEQYQKPFTPVIPVDKVMAWKNRFPVRKKYKN